MENILNIKIRDIVYVDYEETIQMTAKSKGIRLDIYVEDDDNTVFNLEMQTTTYKELPKRSRYYQGIIDLNMIEKGESYDILKESYVIFICTFDFFEKGRSVYEFENVCLEDSEIKLNDGTHKIFLNTKGDKKGINKEMKSLLEYFDGKEPESDLTKQIDDLESRISKLKAQWEQEKASITGEAGIKEEIEKVKNQIDEAERNTDLQTAAELKYGKLLELEKQLKAVQNKEKVDNKLLKEEIDDEDIANVVSKWTGIPVNKLVESEKQKLLNMEDILHKRLVGQEEAVDTVADAIRRARSGLKDPKRPIGTFLFLGPTGVGKTELAKSLAEFMFNDEDALIRIDMSEYMEKHNVSRLVGAPPGYVGYDEGGQLTEAVRRKPYSVVLFDEIEKAHPDVFNIMLQIFDDGRLTDSKGRTVDFKNTLIIMTSNIGSDIILENTLNSMVSQQNFEETKDKVLEVLRSRFKPEFLNRIDETIFFRALNMQDLTKIVDIQMDYLRKLLKDQEIDFEITPDAKEFLATRGFNPVYGARPLKRVIRQLIENPLSKQILAQKFLREDKVIIDVDNDEITFKKQ